MTKSDRTTTEETTASGGSATAMRVIVPLQGVVQGRGGLVLGSFIPCALFYFLQLYLKRNRSQPPPPAETPVQVPEVAHELVRIHSRSVLSPRTALVSSRANSIAKQADSPYYVGLRRESEDLFDDSSNPDGVIQLGLAENTVSTYIYIYNCMYIVVFMYVYLYNCNIEYMIRRLNLQV